MALDFADKLTHGSDIGLVKTDKYRAYNLLKRAHTFVDNPGIGLDIEGMVGMGIEDDALESMVVHYLMDFGCDLTKSKITAHKGTLKIRFDFGGSFVRTITGGKNV